MKTIILSLTALLITLTYSSKATAKVRAVVNINIGLQPDWGPLTGTMIFTESIK
jgi:hypothetical protein